MPVKPNRGGKRAEKTYTDITDFENRVKPNDSDADKYQEAYEEQYNYGKGVEKNLSKTVSEDGWSPYMETVISAELNLLGKRYDELDAKPRLTAAEMGEKQGIHNAMERIRNLRTLKQKAQLNKSNPATHEVVATAGTVKVEKAIGFNKDYRVQTSKTSSFNFKTKKKALEYAQSLSIVDTMKSQYGFDMKRAHEPRYDHADMAYVTFDKREIGSNNFNSLKGYINRHSSEWEMHDYGSWGVWIKHKPKGK